MQTEVIQNKRVIVVCWKSKPDSPFEIFSNLKNFCLSYKQYNYNTLNNYLSKAKTAYENLEIRIERKNVIMKPKTEHETRGRKIVPVIRKVMLKEANDEERDLMYWLSRPVIERAAAVTSIISQSLIKGQRMDKTKVVKKRQ